MRQCIFFTITASFYLGLLAQEHEYVPLVREGVRWNYLYKMFNYSYEEECFVDEYLVYVMQFNGDSIINGKEYKKLYCTFEGTRYLVAFMREQDKRVYGIRVNETCDEIEMKYDFEHFGSSLHLDYEHGSYFNFGEYDFIIQQKTDGEILLYDLHTYYFFKISLNSL